MQLTKEKIIEILDLKPLPIEGGYYRQTYRASETLHQNCLPRRYYKNKAFSTAIYYLITPETFSALHQLPTDEIFHFYLGDPVEMLQLKMDGSGELVKIGQDIENGMFPQVIVTAGTWQGSRLIDGGKFALLGTTMSPAFDPEDFFPADKEFLSNKYPEFKEKIAKLL